MADPLEVKLTGARRVVCDVDGGKWRVAFYRPELEPHKVRELEKRAHVGERRSAIALARLKMLRTTGRSEELREALAVAIGTTIYDREVETIARYILGHEKTSGWVTAA